MSDVPDSSHVVVNPAVEDEDSESSGAARREAPASDELPWAFTLFDALFNKAALEEEAASDTGGSARTERTSAPYSLPSTKFGWAIFVFLIWYALFLGLRGGDLGLPGGGIISTPHSNTMYAALIKGDFAIDISTPMVVTFLGLMLWLILSALAAVSTLCLVTGPRGNLARLYSMGGDDVGKLLGDTFKRNTAFGALGLLLVVVMAFAFYTVLANDTPPVQAIMLVIFLMIWVTLMLLWWFSLHFAIALANALVDATYNSALSMLETLDDSEQEGTISDEIWHTVVEIPTKQLQKAARILTHGWGLSVWFVFVGWLAGAFTVYIAFSLLGVFSGGGITYYSVVIFFVVLATYMIWEPARFSARCARLVNLLNEMCLEDPHATHRVNFVVALKGLNSSKGLGFKATGGVKINAMLLLRVFAASLTFVMTVVPMLIPDVHESCVSMEHAACPYCWTFADGSCYRLYGERMSTENPAKTWWDAEEACKDLGQGTHLASIMTPEQQAVVGNLATEVGMAWIGLNEGGEGTVVGRRGWTWVDGHGQYDQTCCEEPVYLDGVIVKQPTLSSCCTYHNWHMLSPSNIGKNDGVIVGRHMDATEGHASWDNYRKSQKVPYICAKAATPSAHVFCCD